jgi:DNA-binding XRE family transcriptional regulator
MVDVAELTQGATLPPVASRRAIRLAAGVGQTELAEALGVSRWSLIRWETGQAEPMPDARRKYAGALRVLQGATDA